jgi:hypothetical protein
LPRFARGRPRASRRLRRRSTLAEPHPWGIPIEKFNALELKRFAHLVASRSKPTNGLGAAGLHVPNRVVADSDLFSQSLLIKSKQRSRCSQLVSREIHSSSSFLVLHQKYKFGITPKLGGARTNDALSHAIPRAGGKVTNIHSKVLADSTSRCGIVGGSDARTIVGEDDLTASGKKSEAR